MRSKNLILKMLVFTCILLSPITFLIDVLVAFLRHSPTELLSLSGTFLLLIITFVVSAFILVLRERPPKILDKSLLFCYITSLYALLSILLKITVTLVNASKKIIWNINVYSMLLIAAFSVVISACILYVKPQKQALKIIMYFFVIGSFYYLLTVTIGGLAVGNTLILILSAYVAVFTIITLILSLIKYRKKNKELESKPYQKQF